jgi:hypothetical protein
MQLGTAHRLDTTSPCDPAPKSLQAAHLGPEPYTGAVPRCRVYRHGDHANAPARGLVRDLRATRNTTTMRINRGFPSRADGTRALEGVGGVPVRTCRSMPANRTRTGRWLGQSGRIPHGYAESDGCKVRHTRVGAPVRRPRGVLGAAEVEAARSYARLSQPGSALCCWCVERSFASCALRGSLASRRGWCTQRHRRLTDVSPVQWGGAGRSLVSARLSGAHAGRRSSLAR